MYLRVKYSAKFLQKPIWQKLPLFNEGHKGNESEIQF